MPSEDVIELLGGWEGYRVEFVSRHEAEADGAPKAVWIELTRRTDVPMVCSGYSTMSCAWLMPTSVVSPMKRICAYGLRTGMVEAHPQGGCRWKFPPGDEMASRSCSSEGPRPPNA